MAEQPLTVLAWAGACVGEAESQEHDADLVKVRAQLQELPPPHRVVLEMHYLEELSLAQIAEALGIPRGTVKSRLYNARKQLREDLEDSL